MKPFDRIKQAFKKPEEKQIYEGLKATDKSPNVHTEEARVIEKDKYEIHQPGKGRSVQKDFDDSVAYEEVETQLEMLNAQGGEKHVDAVPCIGDEETCRLLDEEYDRAGQHGNMGGG
jgi:hypothetical protein